MELTVNPWAVGYVLQHIGNGKFVTIPGDEKSYTTDLSKARVYSTEDEALRDACGNERVRGLGDLFPNRK